VFFKLLLLFLVVPFVELALLLLMGSYTAWYVPLILVVITGVLGAALARHQGWRTIRRIQRELREGKMPGDAVLDAALILVAGALLLTPGVLTDAVGILLLVPFTRRYCKLGLIRWFRSRFRLDGFGGAPGRSEIIETYVVETKEEDDAGRA
jgi:UPF0716 protein FxsA